MKLDLYTKFILTVIALCLVILSLGSLKLQKVQADAPMKVVLTDREGNQIGDHMYAKAPDYIPVQISRPAY